MCFVPLINLNMILFVNPFLVKANLYITSSSGPTSLKANSLTRALLVYRPGNPELGAWSRFHIFVCLYVCLICNPCFSN